MARNSAENGKEDRWLPLDSDAIIFSDTPTQFTEPVNKEVYAETIDDLSQKPNGYIRRVKFRISLHIETLLAVFQRWLIAERDGGTLFLWQPVFLGLGCLLYFNLSREPLLFAFPSLAVVSIFIAWKIGQHRLLALVFIALGLAALGASLAQWRVARLNTEMLSQAVVSKFSGRVVAREQRTKGRVRYRIEIEKGAIVSSRANNFSGLIQVTARAGGPNITIGDMIHGRARLAPPSGPTYPGGFSFAFQSWFRGIGASGFFYGKPELLSKGQPHTLTSQLARVRFNMAQIIRTALPGRNGALAAALIVGDRSGIDEETAEALRLSGLAHILAISGLHMALVAATVIALFRGIFASFPPLVLHNPVRKWAAGFALAAAAIYLVISGGSVATQRAFIMIAIMLLAVMWDHRALSMRNVAIAALIVLALSPEAILLPGFQMSFAAVAALVATYEALAKRAQTNGRNEKRAQHSPILRFLVRDVGGLALTSLVAGAATGMFAAYHFHRIAVFGLLGNLLAMPIVSLVVMPLALLSVLAMPFGLETGPLWAMSWGIDGVVMAAEFVANLGPHGATGIIPIGGVALGSLGLLLMCLLRTKLRYFGMACFVLAAVLVTDHDLPDVVVLENGGQIGLIIADKPLQLSRPRAEKFAVKIWQRALAPAAGNERASDELFHCDKFGCVGKFKGLRIAHTKSHAALRDDCLLSDVIVLQIFAKNACGFMEKGKRPLTLDRARLAKLGAHSLWIGPSDDNGRPETNSENSYFRAGKQIHIGTAFSGASRPWTRHRYSAKN